MTDPKIFKLPTKTHLKKFILMHYSQQEPFKIDERSTLGKNLMSSLVDKFEYLNMDERNNDFLQIVLSYRLGRLGKKIKQLVYINQLLDEMFEEALIVWIQAQGTEGINPNLSVKNFLAYFGIDEKEYSYDAAYKKWQRSKKVKHEMVKKFVRTRPKFSANLSQPTTHSKKIST